MYYRHGAFETHRVCDMSSGNLTQALADHGVRPDAPRAPQRRQRNLHGEDRCLRHLGFMQPPAGTNFVDYRPSRVFREEAVASLDDLAKGGFGPQTFTHAGPVRPLPGKDEGELCDHTAGRHADASGESAGEL